MFKGVVEPFGTKVWLSSPTMHGDEIKYVNEAYTTNWMSTVGENINEVEKSLAKAVGCGYSVALSSGTAALHLAIKLAGERIYGKTKNGKGALRGHKVFCSDLTFAATVNPIVYEGGEPVFIDSEYLTWNMSPEALEKAFDLYPDVKLIVVAHLYGIPAQIDRIRTIADKYDALIVEDAAESLGATYMGVQTGTFGDYSCISFNGNKIITGSAGGAFLTNSKEDADTIRKWSTQSREVAAWYQHEDLGYNYRMSNVIAGVVRGQLPFLTEHIGQKKKIYMRYKEGLKGLPVKMDPINLDACQPNYWLSCMMIDKEAMCLQNRTATTSSYVEEEEKSCPDEILKQITAMNAEGRPIWKPMHMQPVFSENGFVRCEDKAVSEDIFERGLCLPSDNKMGLEQVDRIVEVIKACFR